MPNTEKTMQGHYFQTLSNIAVILGIVFVGWQLYQDREMKRAELITSTLQDEYARAIAIMGENPSITLSKLAEDAELDSNERIIVNSFFYTQHLTWLRKSILEEMGMLKDGWRADIRLPPSLWANKQGIAYLQSMADNEFNLEGFDDQIRSEIARLESIYNEKSMPKRQNEYWSWPPTK